MPASRRSDSSIVTSQQNGDWVNRTGSKFTNLISNTTCVRLCSLYVDEQVEYEIRQEDCVTTMNRMMSVVSSVGAASMLAPARAVAAGALEVEMYKQFLFDEESVLTSLTEREEDEDDNNGGDDCDEDEEPLTAIKRNTVHRRNSLSPRGREGGRAFVSHQRSLPLIKSHDEDHISIVTQRTH